jgi:hypothetical protein
MGLLQDLGALPHRPQRLTTLRPAPLTLRQRAEVEVAAGGHERPRGQGRHLAVADVGATAGPEGRSHGEDGRDVERVIGRVPGHDGGGQRHAEGVESGGGDLELGPVGVALAAAELQQPLLGEDIGVRVGGGGADADGVSGELVDADGLPVEVAFELGEGIPGAQSGQAIGEAVVGEVDGADGFAQESGEGAVVVLDPGVDVIEAVVALGDEEEEPEGKNVPRSERSLPVQRGRKVSVQGGRQVQPLQGGPEDGQVAHGFDTQQAGIGGAHPVRLRGLTIHGTGQNTSKP